jgi:RimJ/RimL family protein N-acetyltransferase
MAPTLRSERLTLIPAELRQSGQLWRLVRTAPAIEGFPDPGTGPEGVARWLGGALAEGTQVWIIRSAGGLSGLVTAAMPDSGVASVGYYVEEACSERGVAAEALCTAVSWLFEKRGAHRVELRVAAGSTALWRVAQQAGFALEGVARESWRWGGVWHDARSYALLRRDWAAARRRVEVAGAAA